MSLESVLNIVRERGLKIRLNPEGKPYLDGGTKEDRTPALMEALALYRDQITRRLKDNEDAGIALKVQGR